MMLRHLSNSMTAGVLAVTLALTGITATASPASANGHRNNQGAEAAAIFGGLLLLYGISQAGQANGIRHNPPVIHQPRPRQNHRVAPSGCYIQGHDNNGVYRGYRARCMQNHVSRPNLLPGNCLRHVWTHNGQRRIYENQCLANHGWSPA